MLREPCVRAKAISVLTGREGVEQKDCSTLRFTNAPRRTILSVKICFLSQAIFNLSRTNGMTSGCAKFTGFVLVRVQVLCHSKDAMKMLY